MKEKKKFNGWKLTAIISMIINGLIAFLLTIGLASPRSYVKVNAAVYSYDTNRIITSPSKISTDVDYYLYFDWDNLSVYGDDTLYYFPISNSVPNFVYEQPLGSKSFVLDNFDYYTLVIYKNSNSNLSFGIYGYDHDVHSYTTRVIYSYSIQTEPPSIFLEAVTSTYNTTELRSRFRSLFDGSFHLNNAPDFITGYFSQYSVHNLQVGAYDDSFSRFRNVDFESSYSFDRPLEHNSYKYLANNLIVTTNGQRLFGEDEGHDWGYMNALDGIFRYSIGYDNKYCSSLYLVWKPIEVYQLQNFNSVIIDGFIITSFASQQYYYYLDSLCPYDVANEEVLLDSPLVLFHKDEMSYNTTLNQPDNTLRMTSGIYLQQPVTTVLKINLFPSQPQQWANFSYLFRTINHFYYDDGSVIITDSDISNDIENSYSSITGVMSIIKDAFASIVPILSIMVLPGISIGVLLFLPFVLIIIGVVIKLVKR